MLTRFVAMIFALILFFEPILDLYSSVWWAQIIYGIFSGLVYGCALAFFHISLREAKCHYLIAVFLGLVYTIYHRQFQSLWFIAFFLFAGSLIWAFIVICENYESRQSLGHYHSVGDEHRCMAILKLPPWQ